MNLEEFDKLIEKWKSKKNNNLGSLCCTIKRKFLNELFERTKNILPLNIYKSDSYVRIYILLNDITEIPKCPICGNYCSFSKKFISTCGKPKCVQAYQKTLTTNSNYVNYNSRYANEKSLNDIIEKYATKNNFGYIFSIINHNDIIKNELIEKTSFLNTEGTFDSAFRLYCYVNNIKSIKELPHCPICGKIARFKSFTHGFVNTCGSSKCMKQLQTNNMHKAFENYDFSDAVKKHKETCLKKFGVESHLSLDEVKKKKYKTCEERYGCPTPLQSKEIREKSKQTCLIKYGFDNPVKSDLIQEKIYNTLKRNNSYNKSKPEDKLYEILCQIFDKENVIRQYKSEVYPFACDFYIKSKNLYIEYNGNWTHGKHAFDETNPDDLRIVEQWKNKSMEINFKGEQKKFYEGAIITWTIGDVKKRNTAKENNLNYIEIWNIDDIYKKLNKYIYEQ